MKPLILGTADLSHPCFLYLDREMLLNVVSRQVSLRSDNILVSGYRVYLSIFEGLSSVPFRRRNEGGISK